MDGVTPLTASPHTGTATDINGMEMMLENIAQLKKAAGERHQEATTNLRITVQAVLGTSRLPGQGRPLQIARYST